MTDATQLPWPRLDTHRRAAILCPGPSLAKTWAIAQPTYDLRIGVNRAILHFSCHWWSAADWTVLKEVDGRPTVGIVTQDDNVRIANGGTLIPVERFPKTWVAWSQLPLPHPGYSMIAACALAVYLAADTIDIYGDDKAGDKDWDGTAAGKDRGDARWAKETQVFDNAVRKLTAGFPVRFNRIAAPP